MTSTHPARDGMDQAVPTRPATRVMGLDALRAGGALLVVLLHAAIPYLEEPMAGLVWPARSSESSALANALFWWIESFIMPLFFCLSGYGCWMSLKNRGTKEFLYARWNRLGAPLLAAACVILPIELYLWIGGWVLNGELPVQKLFSLKLTGSYAQAWGLSHLWYLQYLLVISIIFGLVDMAIRSLKSPAVSIPVHSKPSIGFQLQMLAMLGLLFVSITATLTWQPEVVTGFQHGFLPDVAKLAYSAAFFLLGALLAYADAAWPLKGEKITMLLFITSIVCSVVSHAEFQQAAAFSTLVSTEPLYQRLMGGLLLSITAMCWTLTCWSGAQLIPRIPTTIAMLAAASFWIYLVHHPIVAALEILAVQTSIPAIIQFPLVASGTLALSWWSYHAFIESTKIDKFLNGQPFRTQKLPAKEKPLNIPTPPTRKAA